jgi:HD superfamily phosphodiesterase
MKGSSFTIKTMKFVTNLYDKNDFTHGWPHILAVRKNALKLQRILGGDKEIIEIAVFFHDCDYSNGKMHVELSAVKAKKFLNSIGYPKTRQVCEAIFNHGMHLHKSNASLESKILFDADKMEIIRPYGVLRVSIYYRELSYKEIIKNVHYYCADLYKKLYFDESRKMIRKDYEKTKKIIEWLKE